MSDNGSWELSADELSLAANRPLITELAGLGVVRASGKDAVDPVSYTHLTLPTT